MDESQLLKGVLEGSVLAIISRGETYGYEIIQALDRCGFEKLQEGTLYPVLTRLEKKKLITCRKGKSPYGPIRKYYSISKEGQIYFEEYKKNYAKVMTAAQNALEGCKAKGEGYENEF